MEIILSEHAYQRSAQRNVSWDEITFIIQHGRAMHNAGVIFQQLRSKDLPRHLPANHPYRRLIGTTVVLCKCGRYVVTLYREAEAFRRDKRKAKRNYQPYLASCPYCARMH